MGAAKKLRFRILDFASFFFLFFCWLRIFHFPLLILIFHWKMWEQQRNWFFFFFFSKALQQSEFYLIEN